jgi:hypothetical protein|tara:strand:- start:54 stop:455 length:402 start_codon:yes stop_codon:yes gene_type:complete
MFRILTILLLSSTLFPNVTNNGATLTIDSDVSVFIDGNFINNGIVNNDGVLDINGLYSGNGSLSNSGTILFNNEMGDATLNGSIDVGDIVIMVEHIIGEYELSDFQIALSDFNDNGYINVTDVVLLIELVLEF